MPLPLVRKKHYLFFGMPPIQVAMSCSKTRGHMRMTNPRRGAGLALLIATHNPDLAARMDRTVRLQDGVLVAA